jgi:hypothetical protein
MSTASVSSQLTTEISGVPPQPTPRPSLEAMGGMIALVSLVWLILIQLLTIVSIGNGLSPTGDSYGEADLVRSAEHYARYGFLADAGLPHITYGNRFPHDGWVLNLDSKLYPLPSGVYTHYPPLANWIGGLLEVTIGFQHLWLWRIVPITCGLLALAYAFFTLKATLNSLTASLVLLFVAIVPMTSTHLHALHYEGYVQALFITELALITRCFFSDKSLSARALVAFCAIAFLQGCFTFDYVFAASAAAIPLMLLARAHGRRVDKRAVACIVVASTLSYVAAHLLHFWQVAHFYGSFSTALQDFSSRARFRSVGPDDVPYAANLIAVLLAYGRLLWFWPINQHFGPLLALLSGAACIRWRLNRTEGRHSIFALQGVAAAGAAGPALIVSYGVAALWLFAMPSHSLIHTHVIPRLFFLPYFVASLDVALRLTAWQAKSQAR